MQINITTTKRDGQFVSQASTVNLSGKSFSLGDYVPDSQVIDNFSKSFSPDIQTGVLNIGLRYISPDRKVIAFEQPPRYVETVYTSAAMAQIEESDKLGSSGQRYAIPVPWLLYVAYLDGDCSPVNVYVFTIKHQLKDLNDHIGMLPLTNFYPDGKLCRAPQDSNEMGFPKNISGAMAATFYAVWMTGFNNDLINVLHSAIRNGTPAFLAGKKIGNNAAIALDLWSRQTFETVANSSWPSSGYTSFKAFIDSNRIREDWEGNIQNYFLNRLVSAFSSASQ